MIRTGHRCFLSKVEIKDQNIPIDANNFIDKPEKITENI